MTTPNISLDNDKESTILTLTVTSYYRQGPISHRPLLLQPLCILSCLTFLHAFVFPHVFMCFFGMLTYSHVFYLHGLP